MRTTMLYRPNAYLAPALIALGAIVVLGCPPGNKIDEGYKVGIDSTLECPNHDEGLPENRSLLPVSRNITTVAEFHDCQRLMLGANTYGPLAGIWVSYVLERMADSLAILNPDSTPASMADSTYVPGRSPPHVVGTGLTFALIYSWDGDYEPLGIKRGWNCLVVYPAASSSGYGAIMAPVSGPDACEHTQMSNLSGVPLWVHARHFPDLPRGSVPPVGRWDQSPSGVQYIGVECGEDWCAVTGQQHFQPSPDYGIGNGGSPEDRRVWAVKGWYDEQHLAVQPLGNPHGPSLPAPFTGTVVPAPDLGTLGLDSFENTWRPVASIALSAASAIYASKYNFTKGDLPHGSSNRRMAVMEMCMDGGGGCQGTAGMSCPASPSGGTWYARITSDLGPEPVYRCVDRVDHSAAGKEIPGTARWRWVKDDEKLWIRCAQGCCTAN